MGETKRKGLGLHWQILIAIAAGLALGVLVDRLGSSGVLSAKWVDHISGFGGFLGDLFLNLLKMLVVPLIFSSLITGVVGVPGMSGLRRMSGWTFGYYLITSVLAITVGITMVNFVGPGRGVSYDKLVAASKTSTSESKQKDTKSKADAAKASGINAIVRVVERMVPQNVVQAASSNATILAIIFFAIMLGIFIKVTGGEHGRFLSQFFESLFEVMMRMTGFVISLAPYGIFGAMIGFAAKGGLAVVGDLGMYMLTVMLALLFHACITLPLIVWVFARRSPWEYARAMTPALLTAFSTASSNGTLPLTMQCVEERAGISPKVSSFTLPLGATINMDGTALYEAVAVLFISQTLADRGLRQQFLVSSTALAASVCAAGIPHAGLVMMVIVLDAVGLPTDAVIVIVAVDRLLDMSRTTVNVWSDSCCAAVVHARSGIEGQAPPPQVSESE